MTFARLTSSRPARSRSQYVLASLLLFVVVRDQLYNGIDNWLHDDVGERRQRAAA